MAATLYAKKPQKVKYEDGVLTATRPLQFKTARGDGPGVFVGHADLPREGASHPDFPGAFVVSISLDQEDDGVFWLATIQYSSEREKAEQPEFDPVEITWSGETYTEAIFQDIDGNAIVNSAGDYFIDPSPSRERTHAIAKISFNLAAVPAWIMTFRDVVNSSSITIDGITIGAGQAMIRRPEISKVKTRNEVSYREVSIDIHTHPDGFGLRPLDAGFREKADGGGRRQIRNADDEEPTTPVPLDGSGHVLENPSPSSVVYGNFQIYNDVDFSSLPGIS